MNFEDAGPRMADTLSLVDDDIRAVYINRGYHGGEPMLAQLAKEIRKLREVVEYSQKKLDRNGKKA